VLVTHDQTEAMTFAREMIVMKQGEVVQAGTPRTLFDRPATDYVGWFIGSPAMNFLQAHLHRGRVSVTGTGFSVAAPAGLKGDGLSLGFRPEHARIVDNGAQVSGTVERIWFEGSDEVVSLTSDGLTMRVRTGTDRPFGPGDVLGISVPSENLLIYSKGRLVA